jgi:hypothetical protein
MIIMDQLDVVVFYLAEVIAKPHGKYSSHFIQYPPNLTH